MGLSNGWFQWKNKGVFFLKKMCFAYRMKIRLELNGLQVLKRATLIYVWVKTQWSWVWISCINSKPCVVLLLFLLVTSLVAQTVKCLPTVWETWVQPLGQGSPGKEMAPHSSTLAWKIPWMEEPARLQPMGSQRVGHDWVTPLSLSFLVTLSFEIF